jgi:hypothetical protein
MLVMSGRIQAFIVILFSVFMIEGCPIVVPLPPGQEVYRSESDIKELVDHAARRDEVIKVLGHPARQYKSDISYRACRKGAGVFYGLFIPMDSPPELHDVHRGETECYELILHFDGSDNLTNYEKIPFNTPYSDDFITFHGEALPTIRSMAEKGFPESQWRLYAEYGKKPEDAIWLCRSADGGYAKAQLYVGHLYWSASDIPDNRIKAYVWYKFAMTGEMLKGQLPDKPSQNQAVIAVQEAEKVFTPEQLAEAGLLYADWHPGQCEQELIGVITGS